MSFPIREGIAGAGSLLFMAQSNIPGADIGDLKGLGVVGLVIAVLIWVIKDERADKKDMRTAFSANVDKMSDAVTKLSNSIADMKTTMETRAQDDLRRIEDKLDKLESLK